jgi:septation ring formation regulator EzrA
MTDVDEEQVHLLFDQLNQILEGKNTSEAIAAVQDLYCALICEVSDDRNAAVELANELHKDLEEAIRKTFDWYHSETNPPGSDQKPQT